MSDAGATGHDGRRGRLTGEGLRRLIDEGASPDDAATPSGAASRPSDATLRDLAAALNIAAGPAATRSGDRAAREAAAVAAFRGASTPPLVHPVPTGTGPLAAGRQPRPGRARRAVVLAVAGALLGSGVAVAAGGGLPFVDSSPGHGSRHPAPDTGVLPSPSASARPPHPPGRPTAAPDGPNTSAPPESPEPSPPVIPRSDATANDRALKALCRAHAGKAHRAPQPLVTAAGGEDRFAAFCATLLSAARPSKDRDSPGAAARHTRRPPGEPSGRSGGRRETRSRDDGHGNGNGHGDGNSGEKGSSGTSGGGPRDKRTDQAPSSTGSGPVLTGRFHAVLGQ